MFAPGQVIDTFRIVKTLGTGGMGTVYEAEHIHLGSRVALKVLHPQMASHPEIVGRFQNEARAAAQLNHPNIVRVTNLNQIPNGPWYIIMDFLVGKSLEDFIGEHRSRGAWIDQATIIQILGEAAYGLFEAHNAGIVHRDIKPANIFLCAERTPGQFVAKVLDFGIAKLRPDQAGKVQTADHSVMGTPPYMAPEQIESSAHVGSACDQYALAVVAYELLTLQNPWASSSSLSAIIQSRMMARTPPNPRDVRPDVSKKLGAVVQRGLATKPAERFADVREFVLAFADHCDSIGTWGSGRDILRACVPGLVDPPKAMIATAAEHQPSGVVTARERIVPVGATPQPSTTLGAATGQSVPHMMPPPSTRRRGLLVGGAVGVVAAIGAVVVVVAMQGSSGSSATSKPVTADDAHAATPLAIDAAPVAPATAALAIVSEPGNARITVDGVDKGAAPVNLMEPVGHDVIVKAELDGYVPSTQTTHVGSQPTTVRITLAPAVPPAGDAGVAVAPPKPPPNTSHHPHHGQSTPKPGSGSGSGSASSSSHVTSNPDAPLGD